MYSHVAEQDEHAQNQLTRAEDVAEADAGLALQQLLGVLHLGQHRPVGGGDLLQDPHRLLVPAPRRQPAGRLGHQPAG